MIHIKRLGLFALVLPFSKFTPVSAAVPPVADVRRAKDMACDQVQALIEHEGHAILTTTYDFVYDTYAFDRETCGRNAPAEPSRIPTFDSPACLVGYKCDGN